MRLLRAVIVLFAATSGAAQERTPEWLFDHGHIGESRAVSQARLAANPRDAVALAWMARTYTLAGDTKTALTLAERAVAADPNYAGGHLSVAESLGGEARKASVFRRLPMARRIKRALDTAVALEPGNIAALSGLMRFYLEAPGVAGGSREKADAIAVRIGAIDAARGFLAQAEVAADRGQRDRIEGLYLKAVAANRDSAHARAALAALYAHDRAKQGEAEAHAKALRALDAALVEPYRVLAVVYARARRWNDLDAILAGSDRHHPANLAALYEAARVLRESGADPARLARYVRRYHAQPPEIGAPKSIG
ncbi:MAG: hypothetical protein M3Q55_15440 [Acidobacteriota bacterium]|nr:hypothetical protein [Acidobacteriota bacterium]